MLFTIIITETTRVFNSHLIVDNDAIVFTSCPLHVSGQPFTYFNWKADSPNGDGGNCLRAAESDQYRWSNSKCSSTRAYYCLTGKSITLVRVRKPSRCRVSFYTCIYRDVCLFGGYLFPFRKKNRVRVNDILN